mgnify:CR=1 FL=1
MASVWQLRAHRRSSSQAPTNPRVSRHHSTWRPLPSSPCRRRRPHPAGHAAAGFAAAAHPRRGRAGGSGPCSGGGAADGTGRSAGAAAGGGGAGCGRCWRGKGGASVLQRGGEPGLWLPCRRRSARCAVLLAIPSERTLPLPASAQAACGAVVASAGLPPVLPPSRLPNPPACPALPPAPLGPPPACSLRRRRPSPPWWPRCARPPAWTAPLAAPLPRPSAKQLWTCAAPCTCAELAWLR